MQRHQTKRVKQPSQINTKITSKTSRSPPLRNSKRRNQTLRQRTKEKGTHFDAVVIGAGIGGIAAALGVTTPQLAQPSTGASLRHPSQRRRVLVIDKENDFCFHSTGRSAAIYSEVYGSPTIRALSTATKPFFYTPTKTGLLEVSEDATDNDLVHKRGSIWVATKKSENDLRELYESTKALVPSLRMISLEEMHRISPPTAYPSATERMDYDEELSQIYGEDDGDYTPVLACLEADAADMDVNSIWSAMAKVATHNGAELVNNVSLTGSKYTPDGQHKWTLNLKNRLPDQSLDELEITSDLVINASGAWADHTNALLGARKHSIQPKQRTIIQFLPDEYAPQPGQNQSTQELVDAFNRSPSIFDVHDRFYYKPDAGRVLASPCDEVSVDAADVSPDELTIAITVERLKQASYFTPTNIIHKWAGLRSFAPDREFVLGFDNAFGKDLIHLTGLGGYGIQTALGNAVCVSGLFHEGKFPQHILDLGLKPEAISPDRF